MGKTCMMASLMHLNREGDALPELPAAADAEVEDEQLAKRPKFKQVTLSNQWRAIPTAVKTVNKPPSSTLVVCPVSLASQWHEELQKMSDKGSMTSFMWYGNDRTDIEKLLAQEGRKKVDVIITSYGTLASEFQKWRKNKDKPSYEGGSIYDREYTRTRTALTRLELISRRQMSSCASCWMRHTISRTGPRWSPKLAMSSRGNAAGH
jgi:DNA repair protein RAD5